MESLVSMSDANLTEERAKRGRHDVALWLLACCVMVFAMVIIGGVTRLTESGLSMVEWRPIFGTLPPFAVAEWERIFALYRESPQYLAHSTGMTLAEFKTIYWWEYVHRLSGRLIGLVFLLPFLWFVVRRRISWRMTLALAGLFALGGLQGVLGWYMVQSGLIDQPRVSPYRLTAHLGLAIAIYSGLLWLLLKEVRYRSETVHGGQLSCVRGLTWIALVLVLVTILSGGFVAGTRAGWAYNTFPFMDGHLVPEGYFVLTPWYLNLFENIAAVQFNHRVLATATLATVLTVCWQSRHLILGSYGRLSSRLLAVWVFVQVALGISTLLGAVPLSLAVAHQAGAVLLLSILMWFLHELRGS